MFRKNVNLKKNIKPLLLSSRVESSKTSKRKKSYFLSTYFNSNNKKINIFNNNNNNKMMLRKNSAKTLTNFNSTNISNYDINSTNIKIFQNKNNYNNNSFNTNNNNVNTNYNSEKSTNCRNLISFKERKLLRQKTINLKMNYSLSIQNSTISNNNLTMIQNNNNFSFASRNNSNTSSQRTHILIKKENLAQSFDSSNNSSINKNNKNYNKNKKYNKKLKIKYPLKQLIKLDPFHLTSPHIFDNIKKFKQLNNFHQEPKIIGTRKTFEKNSIKSLGSCSILIKKNFNKNKTFLLHRLIKKKSNELELNKNFLILIKWECIFKLFNLHMINIVLLVKSYNEMKFFLDKNIYISKMKFKELLITIGADIKNEHENFIDFCYEIFSIDNGETIFIKDFFTALIIGTQKMLYDEKIKFFCNIWKNNDDNNILISEMFFCIKNNLLYYNDYEIIVNFFKSHKEKYIACDKVFDLFINNKQLRKVYMRNVILDLYNIDKNYNNHVNKIVNINMKNLNNNFEDNCCYMFCLNDIKKLKKIIDNIKEKQKKNYFINKKLNEINNNEN